MPRNWHASPHEHRRPTTPPTACRLSHPFRDTFQSPTRPQALGWPLLQTGASSLILAPTGSGKTLTAFLSAIDRLMFEPVPPKAQRCRVLYISPLKALAVDVERNLRTPRNQRSMLY